MNTLPIALTAIGIILEVTAIYWASQTLVSWKKYYDSVIHNHGRTLKEQFKEERKEKLGLIVLLTTAAILQIIGLVI